MTCQTSKAIVTAMMTQQHLFGRFMSPSNNGNKVDIDFWQNWSLDNGAFVGFDQNAFYNYLAKLLPHQANCKFVVVPDVPFNWSATLEKFGGWHQSIANMGFPRAIAVQNGATVENVPWDTIEALFIGGDTEWKRSAWRRDKNILPLFDNIPDLPKRETDVLALVAEAKRRGKWVHFGRQANSRQQLIAAWRWGADSVDGTGETRAPDREFIWIAQTMWELHNQHQLKQKWSANVIRPDVPDGNRQRESDGRTIRPISEHHKCLPIHWPRPDSEGQVTRALVLP